MTEPAARALARFCECLQWDRIPAPARYRTQELLLDHLGVAVRGSAAESSVPVREFVRAQGPGPATVLGASMSLGMPEVQKFGQPLGPPPPGPLPMSAQAAWAALANGTAAHAIEMDDVTTESSLHPGVAVIPAALAVAEDLAKDPQPLGHETRWGVRGLERPSGADVLAAIVAGYEVTIRVGNALGASASYARGFHPTGVAGVFGAAVAAAKLMDLDAGGIERAIGIAGTLASGSLSYLDDGSWTKRLNAGWAAHAGVVAAGLARFEFTGPATALDGPHGVLKGYTDAADPERLTEGLGKSELEIMHVSIKPYGCCRYAHGLIDAVLALRAEHGITADQVEKMRLGVLTGGWPLIAENIERKRDPKNTVDAQFSAPYAAAVALLLGRAGLSEFELFDDARIRQLMARTECYRDPSLDAEYPKRWPAEVEITLRGGRIVKKRIEHVLGEPENPLGRQGLVERFVELVGGPAVEGFAPSTTLMGLTRDDALAVADRVLHFEEERDLSVLEVLA